MKDLVGRLRRRADDTRALGFNGYMDDEAADRIEALEEALDKIAGFAPGNGCEIIAKIARAALKDS